MQNAIELNATGVSMLTRGSLGESMVCFKRALQVLKTACNNLNQPIKLASDTYDPANASSGNVDYDLQSIGWSWSYVFAVHPMATTGGSIESYENYTILSALIMYNMSVALQHRPCKDSDHKRDCLLKELGLLKRCLELMQALPDRFATEQTEISSAVLTTLADVYLQLGDANGYRAALDGLLVLSSRNTVLTEESSTNGSTTIAPAA